MINLYDIDGTVLQSFDDVLWWDSSFVEYDNYGCHTKMYASDGQYFSDSNTVRDTDIDYDLVFGILKGEVE